MRSKKAKPAAGDVHYAKPAGASGTHDGKPAQANGAHYDKLLNPIRERLRPTPEDQKRFKEVEDEMGRRLRRVLPDDVGIGLMGSVAKGTALRHNRDLDVFLLLPRPMDHDRMTKRGLEWAKKAMKGLKQSVNYAQHPYLQVHLKDIKVDIVPSYKIEDIKQMGSAVDRSQLHTAWVNQRVSDAQRDDVRLLKQFCKNLGVYGAQLKVEGFSGYLCELLILKYGSFAALLQAAGGWQKPVVDMANHWSEKQAGEKFPDAAFVVIDPVDPQRNVSAVVSHTSLSRFVLASRAFLKKPAADFFFKEKEVHSVSKLKKMIRTRDTHTLVLSFPVPINLVEDILWPQLKKTTLALLDVLKRAEFRILDYYYWTDGRRAVILLEIMEEKLPAVVKKIGPPAHAGKDVDAFMAKHRAAMNLHVEHERVVAVEKRALRTPKQALEAALQKPVRLGIPSGFLRGMKKRKWGDAYSLLRQSALREVASDYFSRHL